MPAINKSILSTLHDFADACFTNGLNCPHIPDLYGWAMQQSTVGSGASAGITNQPRAAGSSTTQQIGGFLAGQNLGVSPAQITAWLKSQGLKVPRNGIGPLMASVRRNKLGTQQNGMWFSTAKGAATKPANVTTLSDKRPRRTTTRTRKAATANTNQQQQAATG